MATERGVSWCWRGIALSAAFATACGGDAGERGAEKGIARQPLLSTVALGATADTTIRRTAEDLNFRASPTLDLNRSLIKFDASAIRAAVPSGDYLVSGQLRLEVTNPVSRLTTESAYRLTQDWSEAGATWNCAVDAVPLNNRRDCSGSTQWRMDGAPPVPWITPPTSTISLLVGQTGPVSFDVTEDIRAVLSGGSHQGWMLSSSSRSEFSAFDAREGGGGPTLSLEVRHCEVVDCDDGNPCTVDACDATAQCVHTPGNEGGACNDGNACTQSDQCLSGVCSGSNPVVCAAADACHIPGTCNPGTGLCSNPIAPDNTPCSDGDACTQLDICQAGSCTGQSPVVCSASDACHLAGSCNPGTGQCSNPSAPNGTPCTDSDACTQLDTCQAGSCAGQNPVVCSASDACHLAGSCNPSSGLCSNPSAPNGTPCTDSDACTQLDTCQAGSCAGQNPVVCSASDACHLAGTCNPGSGLCSDPIAPDGTACTDGNACTQLDTCAAGSCSGQNPVVCASADACHPAACNPSSGSCSSTFVCPLYGVGSLPASDIDHLVSNATMEDGVRGDRLSAFGSAITYTGVGDLYLATPDRGPNDGLDTYIDRYYLIELSLSGGVVTPTLRGAAVLNKASGVPFLGLSSQFDATNSPASRRLDAEGVRIDPTGNFFVSDEYGPFVYEFDPTGNRVRSLAIPPKFLIANPSAVGTSELPPGNTSGRQANRGMEGLAISPDGQFLYGAMQNALIQDGALNASNARVGINNRILEINVASGATREFLYQLSNRAYGVNELLAINDHQFLAIERDAGIGLAAAFKRLMLIDIAGATDISNVEPLPQTATPAGVTPASKVAFLDLLDPVYGLAGASFPEKIEGLAFGPDFPDGSHSLIVTNDNDGIATNPNNFYVFKIQPAALPSFQAQTVTFPDNCENVSCPAQGACHLEGICNPGTGLCSDPPTAAGTPVGTPTAGDCQATQCDGLGNVASVADNADIPVDNNQCTSDVCTSGVASNPVLPIGTPCSQNGGSVCDGNGACVQCVVAANCPGSDTECQQRTCTNNVCGVAFTAAGTPVSSDVEGDCTLDQCDGAGSIVALTDDSDVPFDNNDCTFDVCSSGVPSHSPAPVHTECGDDMFCDGNGACVGCITAADCPAAVNPECATPVCNGNVCGSTFTAAGTPVAGQTSGDCVVRACDGAGGISPVPDNNDLPPQTPADCQVIQCSNGSPVSVPDNADVPAQTTGDCRVIQCSNGSPVSVPDNADAPSQTAGDCKVRQCSGGSVVNNNDNADLPVDTNQCTNDLCNAGVPSNPSSALYTACSQNSGSICDGAGACIQRLRILRIGDGTAITGNAANPVFVEERSTSGTLLSSIALPTTVSAPNVRLTQSRTATSNGSLLLSADGRFLVTAGYDAAVNTASVTGTSSSTVNRVVGRIDAAGNVDTSTRFSFAFNTDNVRAAASADGSAFWVSGNGSGSTGGVFYALLGAAGGEGASARILGATAPSNVRWLGIANSQLYGSASSGTFTNVFTIGSGLPTTAGQTATSLNGMTNTGGNSYGFIFFDRNAGVAGVDTLYVADERTVAAGKLQKWTFNGSTWTNVANFGTTNSGTSPIGFRGVTGYVDTATSNVVLFATSAEGSDTSHRIVMFIDDGVNTNPTGTVLATAPTNQAFRGISLSPHL